MANLEKMSNNNTAAYLSTQSMLERQRKIYNTVNLSMLPDKGAKIKNKIDELEESLRKLRIEKEKPFSTENQIPEKVVEKSDVSKCDSKGPEIFVSSKCKSEKPELIESIKSDVSYSSKCESEKPEQNDFKKSDVSETFKCESERLVLSKCGAPGDNKAKCVSEFGSTNDALLSFSDLNKISSNRLLNNFVTGSPSFKNWRGPENKKGIKLTEAKPLFETVNKRYFNSSTSSSYCQTVSAESVEKLHNSLATYPDDTEQTSEPDGLKTTMMEHQKKSLSWLIWRESQQPSGGILADDMGLGKTLALISLILKQKELENYASACLDLIGNICRGTLIIAPASIIHQWEEEIIKHCGSDCLTVLLYHGPNRPVKKKDIMDYDVVITTYSLLLPELKKEKSPIFQLKWERIILDEAHMIKNHASQTSQAVFALRSSRKWAVTGTPIHNNFKDMYSLIKFLQLSPFDNLKIFKELISEDSDESRKRRNLLIKSILLRRTKAQTDDVGKPLITMKKKSILIQYIELSAEEKTIYEKLKQKVDEKVNKHFSKHKDTEKGTSNLLVMLLRLQQCCNHVALLGIDADDITEDSVSDLTKCIDSLNLSPPEKQSSDSSDSFNSSLNISLADFEETNLKETSFKSSKIKILFEKLENISVDSKDEDKCVLISQWVSMLSIVADHLKMENKAYLKIFGSTKVEDRQKAVNDFNNNPNGPKVMLLSLKAGGVGLNLTGANHLFLLDLHWNPALEMQACDRIHRVGQKKDVFVHKFVCKDTIEEKILKLQNEKSNLATNVLHGAKKASKGLTLDDFKVLFNVRLK